MLDIGCGWGGIALYLARVCGAHVGITLSAEQLRVATARAEAAGLADRIAFRLQDYRQVDGRFDNAVSVGMFEHVGLRQYPVFFRTAARVLAPDGVMLLHSMAQPFPARYSQPFIEKYIFPADTSRRSPRCCRPSKPRGSWSATPRSCRCAMPRPPASGASDSSPIATGCSSSDERFIPMWEFYLAGEAAFRFDRLHVFHLQLAHDQGRVPLARDYIAAEIAHLAESSGQSPTAPGSTPAAARAGVAQRDIVIGHVEVSCDCEEVCVAR